MGTKHPLSRYGVGIAFSALAHLLFFTLLIRIHPQSSHDIIAPVRTSFITIMRPAPIISTPQPVQPPQAPPEPPPAAPLKEPAPAPLPLPPTEVPAVAAPTAPAPVVAARPTAAPTPSTASSEPITVTADKLDAPHYQASYAPAPTYPGVALNLELEGTVIIRALITPDGTITDHTIITLKGHPSFGRAAFQAIRSWKYPPPHAAGKPVFVWIEIPFEFSLEE